MKKSRIFMTAGALVLAITAIFANKANKRFLSPFSTLLVGGSSGPKCVVNSTLQGLLTTLSGTTKPPLFATMYTSVHNSSIIAGQLYTSGGNSPVFVKH